MNVIITATNSLYFESLLTLISSIHKFGFDITDKIVIYDLGLDESEINILNSLEKVELRYFTESEINLHPEFLNGKSHVYKTFCLRDASRKYENVLWMDSGVCFINKFDVMFEKINSDEIFVVGDSHLNRTYTHDDCIRIMRATEDELNSNQLSTGMFGFKSGGKYQEMIDISAAFSLVPNCCNGDYQNHRHDQSILSILAKRYECPQNDIDIFGYWTDINRNLQTALELGSIVFVHRRGHYDRTGLIHKNDNINNKVTEPVNETTTENVIQPSDNSINSKPSNIKFVDENLGSQAGLSRYISPNTNWNRDINSQDYDIAIYTDRMGYISDIDESKSNYLWLIEPPVINGENYSKITEISHKFKKVFSYNYSIKDRIDNFEFIPHCGTWLRNEDIGLHDKDKNISYIYSDKQWNAGHRLRHNFSSLLKEKNTNVDHLGSGSDKPIDFKINGLKDYRFSIVIENSVENDYFTEKIIDCFLSGTIPIYWGTKNIGNYFDENGIVMLPNIDEWGFNFDSAIDLINTLDINYYNERLSSVAKNFNIAQKYIHPENHILNHI
jgi:hypothetical protein